MPLLLSSVIVQAVRKDPVGMQVVRSTACGSSTDVSVWSDHTPENGLG